MRSNRTTSGSGGRAWVEPLERRQLLSTVLDGDVLNVVGTSGDDYILIRAGGRNYAKYIVQINEDTYQYYREDVASIHVFAGAGNDRIDISDGGRARVTAELLVDPGTGSDQLLGLAADAVVSPDTADPLDPATGQPFADGSADPVTSTTGTTTGTGSQAPGTAVAVPYHYYDAMFFLNEPDHSSLGMLPIYVTDREFLPGSYPNYDHTRADETNTRALARKVADLGQLLVLDIEVWPVDIREVSQEVAAANMAKLMQMLDWIHDERPDLKVGFYSLLPLRDYWTPVLYFDSLERASTSEWHRANLPEFEARYKAWQAANDFLKPLAEKVDFVCPSLYTFYDDPYYWSIYARANIDEARRYNKPVLPFLWMEYHDSTALAGTQLSGDYWRLELDTLKQLADGAVIWGGWQRAWNESAPWWQVTKEFLAQT